MGTGTHEIDDPVPLTTGHAKRPMWLRLNNCTRTIIFIQVNMIMHTYYVVQYFAQNMLCTCKYYCHYGNVNVQNRVQAGGKRSEPPACIIIIQFYWSSNSRSSLLSFSSDCQQPFVDRCTVASQNEPSQEISQSQCVEMLQVWAYA